MFFKQHLLSDFQSLNCCLFGGLALLLLLLCSATISGAEVAFFSLSHKQLTQCRSSKDWRERRVIKLLQRPKRLLATVLILNNTVNVAIVVLSTYLLWHMAGDGEVGGGLLLAYTLASTALIVLFGEVIPKIYANQNNLYVAKKLTNLLRLAVVLCRPLSGLLLRIGRLVGKKRFEETYELSMEKLGRALELTTAQEASAGEREILKGVINFSKLTVKQTMQPRTDITAVDAEMDFHQLIGLVNESKYSRLPVYKDTIDHVEGVLHTKDLMPYLEQDKAFAWQKLLHKAFFVPENKKINTLLTELQQKKTQMAIVVDEYGGTAGLITMEDVVEEIIGDIVDEFDEETALYRKIDDHTFVFEGKISLNDFCKAIEEKPATFREVKGESKSLAGLLLEMNSRLPLVNETMSFQRFKFTIVAADPRKIKRIRVEITPQQAESSVVSEAV